MEFSIQHVHDGTAKLKVLVLFYYKTHRVQKGEALFNKPPKESRCLPGRSFRLIPLRSSGCSQDLEG